MRRPKPEDAVRCACSKTVTVVDPGTTTLRALTVESAGDAPVVWGWGERPGSTEAGVDRFSLAGALEGAVEQAEVMARQQSGRDVRTDQLLVGLPGWQLRGWAWPIAQGRNHPEQPVEEKELSALLQRALRLSVNRLAGKESRGWVLVDALPVALTVDGHRVTDPVGFRGKEIGASVFAALTRVETVQTWQRVARDLRYAALTLTTAPLALVAGRVEPQGILVDVGGGTTSVTWWQSGRPVALASLPAGGASLTHALRRKWGLAGDKAEQLKLAYSMGALSDDTELQVREVMVPVFKGWLAQTERVLAQMGENAERPLPQLVYLFGGGSMMPGVPEGIRTVVRSQRLTFDRYPEIRPLRPADVPGAINHAPLGRGAADISALALAAWVGRGDSMMDRPTSILADLTRSEAGL